MSEFGALPTTETAAYGKTRNPWGLDHTPGGSSGRSAAAVAAGIVPLAHAIDGAGSIRIPASNCGLVGLKPSRHRTPGAPGYLAELDLSAEFCVSRTVRDSANLMAQTQRRGADAAYSPVAPVTGPSSRRLRIGYVEKSLGGHAPSPEVSQGLLATAKLLDGLGHHVEETRWPFDTQAFLADFTILYLSEGSQLKRRLMLETGMDAAELTKLVEPAMVAFSRMGDSVKPATLEKALARVAACSQAYFDGFSAIDVLLCPVLLKPPAKIGDINGSVPLLLLAYRLNHYADYTMVQNATGGPAISLPLAWTADGLPVGMQFAAPLGDEATLLALAFELEEAKPWMNRHPPVWAAARI